MIPTGAGDGSLNDVDAAARPGVLYRYRFGGAELDETRSALSVDGTDVELEQRPLQVLVQLLRHPGEVVTREELFETVWAGRPTVDNVLANAVAKLRKALGPANAERITTVPRVGYRLEGPIERIAAGRALAGRLDLAEGMPVPGRPHFRLHARLGPARGGEVWLARHEKTGEPRVYKFSADGECLAALKREATIHRVLRDTLGERGDFVRILDWNFDAPPFFLECEYGGVDLAAWAADDPGLSALDPAARIALFLQIADAVAAAHEVGVLHKDLKPGNVLITARTANGGPDPRDSAWAVRLTDFGSSRLLEPGRLAALGITALGLTVTQAVTPETSGTVLYLAPELLAGEAPTVQSDLYALGLMLYQLMIGDLRRPLVPGWEQDVPDELLREDIAAATDGSRARRLRSVGELCERLRRRPERLAERAALREAEARAREAERLLERSRARRPWVAAALALLVVGLGVGVWQFDRVRVARNEARRQAAVATAVGHFMTDDLIAAADPGVSGRSDVTVIEAVRSAIPQLDHRLASNAPRVQAALHLALGKVLVELSDPKSSVAESRKALALYERLAPPDPEGLNEARIWLAYGLSRVGQFKEADALLDRAEHDMPRLAEQHPQLQLRLLQARSMISGDKTDYRNGYRYDAMAWALARRMPDISENLRDSLEFDLAESQARAGELKQSEATLHDLIGRQSLRLGAEHQQTLYSTVLLANTLVLEKRFAEAEQLIVPAIKGLGQALGAGARRTLLAKSVLANIELQQHEYLQAAALYDELHAAMAKQYGEGNQGSIAFLMNQATATRLAGNARAAEPLYRRVLANARAHLSERDSQVQHVRYHLAECLLTQHRHPQEAAALLAGLEPAILDNAERTPDWLERLAYENGRALLQQGRPSEAVSRLEEAERLAAAQDPDDVMVSLAAIREQLDAARAAVEQARAGHEATQPKSARADPP